MASVPLPDWAETIRSTYLRGEASVFILHGNVHDLILHDGKPRGLVPFLQEVLLAKKDAILHYNPSVGVRTLKKTRTLVGADRLAVVQDPEQALPALEKVLRGTDGVGIVLDYVDLVAPDGSAGFQTEADRRAVMTLHRWSLDPDLERQDNVVLLVCEQLSNLSGRLLANPRIAAVEIPLPDGDARGALIRRLEPDATEREVERLSARAAGLKSIQIRGILSPGEDSEADFAARYDLARTTLASTPEAGKRAKKLAQMFSGQPLDRLRDYLRNQGHEVEEPTDRYDEVLALLEERKRALLERECFGMVEFVRPAHDFSAVGGMEEVKRELMQIAHNIREGRANRVPMGLLFTGPMGTGKTFVAEAFARSSGLVAIKLKNFRSRWVGATEGNLEKILSVVRAIGNVLVMIDEGDRAFGTGTGESDGGTTSRVIARIKEFMSDPTNRGRVLFVLMTNRPDKLDIDIKRAGRLDRKIPFFYSQDAEEVEPVLLAQLRRHHIAHDLQFPRDREAVAARLVGWSNADVEAVTLSAFDRAERAGESVQTRHFEEAILDYLPARDSKMLEYMELLAAFEASSRRLLPRRYAELDVETLAERLDRLRPPR